MAISYTKAIILSCCLSLLFCLLFRKRIMSCSIQELEKTDGKLKVLLTNFHVTPILEHCKVCLFFSVVLFLIIKSPVFTCYPPSHFVNYGSHFGGTITGYLSCSLTDVYYFVVHIFPLSDQTPCF